MNWFSLLEYQWAALLILAMAGFSYFVGSRTHWSVAPFLFVASVSGIKTHLMFDPFLDSSMEALLIGRGSANAVLSLVLVSGFFAALPAMANKLIPPVLTAVFALACGAVFFKQGNASMNGALAAVLYPVALRWFHSVKRPIGMVVGGLIALAVVYGAKASIPLGVLAVVTMAFITQGVINWIGAPMRNRVAWIVGVVAFAGLVGFVGYWSQGAELFSSTGRFENWKVFLDYQNKYGSSLFGSGFGSGATIFPALGREHHTAVLIWAHNDWLQLLFETGVIGLSTAALAFFYGLKHARNHPWLFGALLGYGANAFFNFPVHHAVHAFVGASLLWLAHRGRE